jgi:hypothetical protein
VETEDGKSIKGRSQEEEEKNRISFKNYNFNLYCLD